jgi:hypothetical protein
MLARFFHTRKWASGRRVVFRLPLEHPQDATLVIYESVLLFTYVSIQILTIMFIEAALPIDVVTALNRQKAKNFPFWLVHWNISWTY